jgi:hypothetical protein
LQEINIKLLIFVFRKRKRKQALLGSNLSAILFQDTLQERKAF